MNRGGMSPGSLFVSLLGGFRVAAPHAENGLVLDRKKTRALLAVLALDPGRMMSRARLTALLWSEQSEDTARHGLRQCLLDLRHALAKGKVEAIRTEGDVIGLEPSRIVVDVVRFNRLAGQGNTHALAEAMSLYHGDLLEGFTVDEEPFEAWLQVERERLRSRAVEALRKLLEEYVRAKSIDAAVAAAVRLLTFEPFDEAVHRTLMRVYAESGRRSTALRQYEVCVDILDRELGVEPEPETRDLYRRLIAERGTKALTSVRPPRKATSRAVRPQGAYRSPAAVPLIGRENDLTWLEALWKHSRQGIPQLALIVGEAGIGKSRLVGELASRAQRRSDELLLGRGREGEDVLPFAPWIEALRPVLSEQMLERLTPVARLDLARLFPEIVDGPGPPPSGLEDGPRIFEAVAHLLRLLATKQPLVVVLEDLHWCDDMTVRLLRFLPRRLAGQPVLLVGTARPEEMVSGSDRGAVLDATRRDPACVSTTLAPLPRGQAIELFQIFLASRDAELSPALAERVWRLSEGNPFVVIECARAVRDRDAAAASGLLTELPDQVRALTDRYLADLGVGATRLAAAAAVIGRDFEVPVICRASGLTQSEAADALEELVRRRVIREVSGRFDFRHDRVREAAYARLLGSRRVLLHHSVAEALEVVYAADLNQHCAAIGAHYRHAGHWSKACDYLTRAGYLAWERGAGREALACFEDALKALAEMPDSAQHCELRVRLHLVANGASVAAGSYERGRVHLHEAAKLAEPLGNRRWQGRVAAVLSNSYRAPGPLDRALHFGETALALARETEDRWLEPVALQVMGAAEWEMGNYRQSLVHLEAVLSADLPERDFPGPFFPHVDRPATMRIMARYFMVLDCTHLGEFQMASRLVDESLRESDIKGDPLGWLRIPAYMTLGRLHYAFGDFHAAVRAHEYAVSLFREGYHFHYFRPLSWELALCYALSGRAGEGLSVFERLDASERAIGQTNVFRWAYLTRLGHVLLEAGRVDAADRIGNDALAMSRKAGARGYEATAHALLADVAALRIPGAEEVAEHHLKAALALAETLEMRPLMARCHQRLAWLYETTGNRADHERHSATAASLVEGLRIKSLAAAGI